MNVLLTAVGRRSYLVRYFQAALAGRGLVVATNTHPDTPGMHVADIARVVPASHDPGYVDAILDVCREHDVRMLCSCHDLDVYALSLARDRLTDAGITAVLPNADWAMTCLDKYACGLRLREAGFAVPWSSVSVDETRAALESGALRFPLIVKARLGFGSLGLNVCHGLDDLVALVNHARAEVEASPIHRFLPMPLDSVVLIQQMVPGPERCLDIVHDLEGRYAAHFISEIHAMRAGESDTATTVSPNMLGDLPQRLSQLTRHVGVWGFDFLMNDGNPVIIDVNPRFTGDYPFQHIAGANVPAALLAWAGRAEPESAWLSPALGVKGFKDLVPTRIMAAVNPHT
jgi:carbamoyl-phosphate synthase large subunit